MSGTITKSERIEALVSKSDRDEDYNHYLRGYLATVSDARLEEITTAEAMNELAARNVASAFRTGIVF